MRNDAGINGEAQRIEQMTWILFLKVYDTKEQSWKFHNDRYQSVIPQKFSWKAWASIRRTGKCLPVVRCLILGHIKKVTLKK
jgi:type I restriction enzyme M protein